MPCLAAVGREVKVPPPGAPRDHFLFHRDGDRKLFLIMPTNHPVPHAAALNPRIAIVGLSPAANQIQGFLDRYRSTRDYNAAAQWASFKGMEEDIIGMFVGLGVDRALELRLRERGTLAAHPGVLTESLVKCASLSGEDSSDDFDPTAYGSNVRCITHRFLPTLANPALTRLSHVFIFGKRAQAAVASVTLPDGRTVERALHDAGRQVIGLPHPSGQNGEHVALAKLSDAQFPDQATYAARKWQEYASKPPRPGRKKQAEAAYKEKRRTYWAEVAALRAQFAHRAA